MPASSSFNENAAKKKKKKKNGKKKQQQQDNEDDDTKAVVSGRDANNEISIAPVSVNGSGNAPLPEPNRIKRLRGQRVRATGVQKHFVPEIL